MKATQKAAIRRQLLKERERIVTEWQNHGGNSGSSDDWDSRNVEERAIQIANDQIDRRIADDDLNLLHKVMLALKRLDEGTYTECEHCGNTIPTERLVAKPSVSLCIACQTEKDAGRLQPS